MTKNNKLLIYLLIISSIIVGSYPVLGIKFPSWPLVIADMINFLWFIVILWPWLYLLLKDGVGCKSKIIFLGTVSQVLLVAFIYLFLSSMGNNLESFHYYLTMVKIILIIIVLEITYLAFCPVYGHLLSLIKSLRGFLALLSVFLFGLLFVFSLPLPSQHPPPQSLSSDDQRPVTDITEATDTQSVSKETGFMESVADHFQFPEMVYGFFIYLFTLSLLLWPWIHIKFKRGSKNRFSMITLAIIIQFFAFLGIFALGGNWPAPDWYNYLTIVSGILFIGIILEILILIFYFLPTWLFGSYKKIHHLARLLTLFVIGIFFLILILYIFI